MSYRAGSSLSQEETVSTRNQSADGDQEVPEEHEPVTQEGTIWPSRESDTKRTVLDLSACSLVLITDPLEDLKVSHQVGHRIRV